MLAEWEQRWVEPNDPSAERIRRGCVSERRISSARLLDSMPGSVIERHHAREGSQRDEQKAEAIIRARLKKLGWAKTGLEARRKSDPHRVALARDLRGQTTVSLK